MINCRMIPPGVPSAEGVYRACGFGRTLREIKEYIQPRAADWLKSMPSSRTVRSEHAGAYVLTGGAGFLGSEIARGLLRAGERVVIVSRNPMLSPHLRKCIPNADKLSRTGQLKLISADISTADTEWISEIPRAHTIIHLAANVHAFAGMERLTVNITGLRGALMLAVRDGAFLDLASTLSVYVSSSRINDNPATVLQADDTVIFGGYAQTKAACELLLPLFPDISSRIIRYGLLVPNLGNAFPAGHFAPLFMKAMCCAGLPENAENAAVDITPVGKAAESCIGIPCKKGDVIHEAALSPALLSDIIRLLPAPVQVFSNSVWMQRIRERSALERMLLFSAFRKSDFLKTDARRGPFFNADLFQATGRNLMNVLNPHQLQDSVVKNFVLSAISDDISQ